MNKKQETILVHKIEVVCNLVELYIKEHQKPKPQTPPPKPSARYDSNLNRVTRTPKRAYVTFRHGVVFLEVPDNGLN